MYYETKSEKQFFQGDILKNVPIVRPPNKIQIARQSKEDNKEKPEFLVLDEEKVTDAYADGQELILAYGKREAAIVLSQTCDIQNREFIIISPLFLLSSISGARRQEEIRKQNIYYRFYLPKSDFFEESYTDLTLLFSIRKDLIKVEDRLISLTDYWRSHLTWVLGRYFCRPHRV